MTPIFYKHGWYNHFKWGMPKVLAGATEVHVTVASVGTKKKQMAFTDAIRDVLKQTEGKRKVRFNVWPCSTDPCLQFADYCTWAIQRKWESRDKDCRSYDLIKDQSGTSSRCFAGEPKTTIEGVAAALPTIFRSAQGHLSPGANRN